MGFETSVQDLLDLLIFTMFSHHLVALPGGNKSHFPGGNKSHSPGGNKSHSPGGNKTGARRPARTHAVCVCVAAGVLLILLPRLLLGSLSEHLSFSLGPQPPPQSSSACGWVHTGWASGSIRLKALPVWALGMPKKSPGGCRRSPFSPFWAFWAPGPGPSPERHQTPGLLGPGWEGWC